MAPGYYGETMDETIANRLKMLSGDELMNELKEAINREIIDEIIFQYYWQPNPDANKYSFNGLHIPTID